jgi:hypothetical protein
MPDHDLKNEATDLLENKGSRSVKSKNEPTGTRGAVGRRQEGVSTGRPRSVGQGEAMIDHRF